MFWLKKYWVNPYLNIGIPLLWDVQLKLLMNGWSLVTCDWLVAVLSISRVAAVSSLCCSRTDCAVTVHLHTCFWAAQLSGLMWTGLYTCTCTLTCLQTNNVHCTLAVRHDSWHKRLLTDTNMLFSCHGRKWWWCTGLHCHCWYGFAYSSFGSTWCELPAAPSAVQWCCKCVILACSAQTYSQQTLVCTLQHSYVFADMCQSEICGWVLLGMLAVLTAEMSHLWFVLCQISPDISPADRYYLLVVLSGETGGYLCGVRGVSEVYDWLAELHPWCVLSVPIRSSSTNRWPWIDSWDQWE